MTTKTTQSGGEEAMTELFRGLRIIPVIVIKDAERAVPLARALIEGGLPCAEVTFRTAAAREALSRIAGEHPEMLVGAGTVLTPEQVRSAKESGARFIVSPGFNPRVVDACREEGIPVFPGVATPTEIEAALERGLRTLKLFPAEAMGGTAFLKAISAPYGGVNFIPTGGIGVEELPGYLKLPSVVACGGSWLAPSAWIDSGDFDRIRVETRSAVERVRELSAGSGV